MGDVKPGDGARNANQLREARKKQQKAREKLVREAELRELAESRVKQARLREEFYARQRRGS